MESQGHLGILHSNPLGVMCQSFFRCIAACPPLLPLLRRPRRLCHRVVSRLPDDPTRRPRKLITAALSGFLSSQIAPEAASYFTAPAQIAKSTTCGSCTSMYISFSTDAFTNSVPALSRTLPWPPCICPKRCSLGTIFSTTLVNSSQPR
jgi:hypothetical protein